MHQSMKIHRHCQCYEMQMRPPSRLTHALRQRRDPRPREIDIYRSEHRRPSTQRPDGWLHQPLNETSLRRQLNEWMCEQLTWSSNAARIQSPSRRRRTESDWCSG